MTLGLFDLLAPLLILGLLVWLIVGYLGYRKVDETLRIQQHEEIMKALLDGAISRARILALVEQLHEALTSSDSSSDPDA